MAPLLSDLLDRQAQQSDAMLGEFLRLTFDQMAARGMRDHIGGGFFRYTVDPDWDTPHFEKMLYDNAQLAVLYLRAATVLEQPRYREIARGTPGSCRMNCGMRVAASTAARRRSMWPGAKARRICGCPMN